MSLSIIHVLWGQIDTLTSAERGLAIFTTIVLGGVIGSFMNVVIYRVPAGLSLSHPGSRCPKCLHPIRWYDNLPVFGWILLRGRCRDCQTWIPLRYPLVEAIVAVVFFTLLSTFVLIPDQVPWQQAPSLTTRWIACGYHLWLMCTLICLALIRFDGHEMSGSTLWRILAIGFLVGLIVPVVVPGIRPLLGLSDRFANLPTQLLELISGLLGAVAGWIVGTLARPSTYSGKTKSVLGKGVQFTAAMVGCFLGWQAISLIVLVAAAIRLIRIGGVALRNWTIWITLSTFCFLNCWSWLAARMPRIIISGSWVGVVVSLILVTTWLTTLPTSDHTNRT